MALGAGRPVALFDGLDAHRALSCWRFWPPLFGARPPPGCLTDLVGRKTPAFRVGLPSFADSAFASSATPDQSSSRREALTVSTMHGGMTGTGPRRGALAAEGPPPLLQRQGRRSTLHTLAPGLDGPPRRSQGLLRAAACSFFAAFWQAHLRRTLALRRPSGSMPRLPAFPKIRR